MSKSVYINRSYSSRPSGGGLRRILAIILLVVLMAVAAVLYFVQRQNDEADSVMERFEAALEAGNYDEVMAIHTQAQERSLSKSQSEKNQGIYAEAVIEIEDILFGRIDDIMRSLTTSQNPTLAEDDLAYLTGLEDFSASKLTELISSMGLRVLSGETTTSQARRILSELGELSVIADDAAAMRGELPALDKAGDAYRAAMTLFENESYIAAATALADALKSPDVVLPDTLANRLFASELVRVRQTMRPILINQLQGLMDRNRFITAERQMEDLLRFFPDDNEIIALYEEIRQNVPTDLVQYSGNLEHITLRPLIVNTAVGLGDTPVAQTADSTMLTSYEFRKILEQLHLNNFVLMDIESLLNDQGTLDPILLPPGKKPLFLTLEGFNYYPARKLSGNVENLIIDDDGHVAGVYTDANGQRQVKRESEAIGILDAFVEEHPDFSFDGAKGTITLTGNMGVFGYVFDESQLMLRNQQAAAFSMMGENYTAEQFIEQKNQAKAVIDALKDTGWTFGSQSFSGIELTGFNEEQLAIDTTNWKETVGVLTGDVKVLAYPNGSILTGDDPRKTYLQEQGFRYFLGMGPNPYVVGTTNYLYMDRLYLGGYAIRNGLASRLFDVATVYDPMRKIPLS